MEGQVKEKTKRNEERKARLLELKKGQEKVAERLAKVKSDKERLTSALEERTERCIVLKQESEKLRPYAQQSSSALQTQLAELSENLVRDKSQIDTLEKRTRALQTSADTFGVVANDVSSCIKVLEEVSNELAKEDEEKLDTAKRQDALAERTNNVREVVRTEALLQRQLSRWVERTETLRKGSAEKAEAAKKRMEELRGVHRRLTEESGEKRREMERRKVGIEQMEKKVSGFVFFLGYGVGFGVDVMGSHVMASCLILIYHTFDRKVLRIGSWCELTFWLQMTDLKDNIENEIQSAHTEFLKMDSHIKLYITEMEQAI